MIKARLPGAIRVKPYRAGRSDRVSRAGQRPGVSLSLGIRKNGECSTNRAIASGAAQDSKGISRGYGPDIAWFRDPAGNVLAVLHESAG